MDFTYPYTDFHELNLDWFLAKFKELVDTWNSVERDWNDLHDFVQNYFDNLSVQGEIDHKLDEMVEDGTLARICEPFVSALMPTEVGVQLPGEVANQIGAVVAAQIDAVVAGQLPDVAAVAAGVAASEWLAAHVDPDTGYVIDDSLTISGAAADAKTVGDKLNKITDYFIECPNLLNLDEITEDKELSASGNVQDATGYFYSDYIPVKPGQTICCHYPTGHYGQHGYIQLYDESKNRTGRQSMDSYETDDNGKSYVKITFAVDATAKYFRINGDTAAAESWYMYVYANAMPSVYIPYTTNVTLSDDVKVKYDNIIDKSVSIGDTDFIKNSSVNLNNIADMVIGVINNSSTNGNLDSSVTNWASTDFIPVNVGEVYKLNVMLGVYYGTAYKGICCYDSNKSFIGHIIPTGGIQPTGVLDTITITLNNTAYIRTSYPKSYITNPKQWYNTQIFKGNNWTNMYIANDGIDSIQDAKLSLIYGSEYNPLIGKSIMWNGDSICAADNDPDGGWVYRISVSNQMYAKNYGVSAATIAENVEVGLHSVCASLDDMITDFPNADYIIIEGGTNDADRLGSAGIGTFDSDDFSPEYITALDKDTFSGALESIFYRLVTQMKTKHIGYLIPQKMGVGDVRFIRRTYFDRAIAICQKWGIPYLDLWNNLYFNPRLSAHYSPKLPGESDAENAARNESEGNLYLDGQHLTTTGYTVQSPIIAEWIKQI